MKNQKGFSPILIIVGTVVILGIAGGAYYFGKSSFTNSKPQNIPVNSQAQQPVPATSTAENKSNTFQTYTNNQFGFSVTVPQGWSYETKQEKVLDTLVVVELINEDKKIRVPISVAERSWESVQAEVKKNFKSEAIKEITLAGQPAFKVISKQKEINPGYTFRIKHPGKQNTVLLGTASYIRGEDLVTFHQAVENLLNSLKFTK